MIVNARPRTRSGAPRCTSSALQTSAQPFPAAAGPLTDAFGGRWMWAGAGLIFLGGSAVAFVMARRLGPAEVGQAELTVVEPLPEPQHAAAH